MKLFSNLKEKSDAALIAKMITDINRQIIRFNLTCPISEKKGGSILAITNIQKAYNKIGEFILKAIEDYGEPYLNKLMKTECEVRSDGEVIVAFFGNKFSNLEQVWMKTKIDLGDINNRIGQNLIKEPFSDESNQKFQQSEEINISSQIIDCPYLDYELLSEKQMITNLDTYESSPSRETYLIYPKVTEMILVCVDTQKEYKYSWRFIKKEGRDYTFKDSQNSQWILGEIKISLTRVNGTHITFMLD